MSCWRSATSGCAGMARMKPCKGPEQDEPLFSMLGRTWCNGVADDYCKRRIVSERAQQASLFHHLVPHFRTPDGCRDILVEPAIGIPHGRRWDKYHRPDLCLIHREQPDSCGTVLAVIELKFKPFHKCDYQNDIKKLDWIWRKRGSLVIYDIDPESGQDSEREFKLGSATLFVFASIHSKAQSGNLSIDSLCKHLADDSELHEHLRYLEGLTAKDGEPKFIAV